MLEYMRKAANTWVFKIFFAILIASFAFFGLGNFGGGGGSNVATVGAEQITYYEFDRLLKGQAMQARKAVGDTIPMAQLLTMLRTRVLQQLIQQKLLNALAKEMKLEIADEVIKEVLARQFMNGDGHFDSEKFQAFLHNAGYSEKQFIEILKEEIARTFVTDAIFPVIKAPKVLALPLYNDYYSPRTIKTISFDAAKLPKKASPTRAELEAFYTDHQEAYGQPELRTVEALVFDPRARVKQVQLKHPSYSAQEIRQAALEANHELVQQVEDKLSSGATFKEISDEYGILVDRAENVTLAGRDAAGADALGSTLISPKMLETAFGLEPGAESDVSELKDGRAYIIKVVSVTPAKARSFEEVAGQVKKDYQAWQDEQALSTAVQPMVEALNSGEKSLVDLGRSLNVSVVPYENVVIGNEGPAGLSSGLIEALSKQPVGKFFSFIEGNKAFISVVTALGKPKAADAAQNFEKVQNGLQGALAGALYQSLIAFLKTTHKVEVNKALLKAMDRAANAE